MDTPTLSFLGLVKIRKEDGDVVVLQKERALKISKWLEVK
jgi:hypothetical protein